MTADEELRAALAAPSLEAWLDTRCGLGERAYLDWVRAAIAAANEAHALAPVPDLTQILARAMAWASSPSPESAAETTRLAFEDSEQTRARGPVSDAHIAVLRAAAAIESVGASWRENAELAIGDARRALRNGADEATAESRLARAIVDALAVPVPGLLPRPPASVRSGSLSAALPALPTGWRWHSDWDPSLGRHVRAIARDRACPMEPPALDQLLTFVERALPGETGGWTLERRASGELEARAMIEILDAPDRAHVRIALLRDRHGHDLVTLASIGAETTGAIESLVATAIDRALDPNTVRGSAPPQSGRARKPRTSATDLGRRVVESLVATAEGRPALPLGWRWTPSGRARTERAWPRDIARMEALLSAAADILGLAGPVRWTRTWRAGGPALLRASLDESALDVRFADSRASRTPADLADLELRAPSVATIARVAHALDRAAAALTD